MSAASLQLPVPVQPARLAGSGWSQRYGKKHHMRRVTCWPTGITPPKKVRVYFRNGHWLLQWWDPQQKRNVPMRVEGDLVEAIARAREIDEQLLNFKRSGTGDGKLTHPRLVEQFVHDLQRRADADQISPRTVERYRSALGHYRAFTDQPQILSKYRLTKTVDRDFALEYGIFLRRRAVSANGRAGARKRPMKDPEFATHAARALLEWAADPQRGNLMPAGFINPFRRGVAAYRKPARDLFGDPDITVTMAKDLLEASDDYQLRLFSLMVFHGLRAAEPAYLFREYLDHQWLRVPCNPELGYTTKGKRDKRLPLFPPLTSLLHEGTEKTGLLFVRRAVLDKAEVPPLLGYSLTQLSSELQKRIRERGTTSPAERQVMRDKVLREAGAINYDYIEAEFQTLAKKLKWSKGATLKDLRHLFRTSLMNGRVPEPVIQYLMGQSPSRAAITAYTHLEPKKLRDEFLALVHGEWAALADVLSRHKAAND